MNPQKEHNLKSFRGLRPLDPCKGGLQRPRPPAAWAPTLPGEKMTRKIHYACPSTQNAQFPPLLKTIKSFVLHAKTSPDLSDFLFQGKKNELVLWLVEQGWTME